MKINKHIFLLSSITCVVILLSIVLLKKAAFSLVEKDDCPPSLDVLFIFGGEEAREKYSFVLAREYVHTKIVVSGLFKTKYLLQCKENNLDTHRVSYVDSCSNTMSEVFF